MIYECGHSQFIFAIYICNLYLYLVNVLKCTKRAEAAYFRLLYN